jgi:2-dehydro-3-deoxyphosphogluconate aldolase/(4S)-4-hydroxy-2-oxoglutarate aldolase
MACAWMDTHTIETTIASVGLLPSVRTTSADEALFVARAILGTGLGVIEIEMNTPGGETVVARACREFPTAIVGAGTVLDVETAVRAMDAGARFVSIPGLDDRIVGAAEERAVAAIVGGLTPTEILTAWRAGASAVKVFPCGALGGDTYIAALRGTFPDVPLIAAGGVTQRSAAAFIHAGATALGIGRGMVPPRAVKHRQEDWITELVGRFRGLIHNARQV